MKWKTGRTWRRGWGSGGHTVGPFEDEKEVQS